MAQHTADPVCGMEVDPENPPATEDYKGATYYFCDEFCRQQFIKDPPMFVA